MTDGDGPPPGPRPRNETKESLLTRFWTAEEGPLMFIREVLTSVAAVALIGLLLFAVSGVWPPMVAVESPSMDPHMQKGDLVFISEPGRFVPAYAQGQTGVVTQTVGEQRDYRTFDGYGSVVIYDAPGRIGPPIIHRAMFWVDDGENWYDEANPEYLRGDSCEAVPNCPAPHAGFITKGDNNAYYDQVSDISTVVRPDWVVGVAHVRIPYLGWVRLGVSSVLLEGASPAMVDAPTVAGPESVGVAAAEPVATAKPVAGHDRGTTAWSPSNATGSSAPSSPPAAASGPARSADSGDLVPT